MHSCILFCVVAVNIHGFNNICRKYILVNYLFIYACILYISNRSARAIAVSNSTKFMWALKWLFMLTQLAAFVSFNKVVCECDCP